MLNLDDLKVIKKYDGSNMLDLIESFPSQCRAASKIGFDFNLPDSFRKAYKNIVCTGLGGSAIGADIARSYVADEAKMPIIVNRNYTLPNFVDEESLVIISSYSGNTEETLSAYKDARSRKARIIAITSGGELERSARQDGFPVVIIPKGLPPRCALGYSFFPLLVLLSKIGLIKDQSNNIDNAIKTLEQLKEQKIGSAIPQSKNISKTIAGELYLKYPIIYGGQDHIDSIVTRWRGQLAENSKTLASSHIFPEMNHNEIVGWENPKKLLKDIVVIILRDAGDHRRTSIRMDITKKIIENEKVRVIEVESTNTDDPLARMFSLVYIGDFVSFYLAILNKRDPTPVERITYLKEELAKG